ncbi:hypothetical protein ABPG72_000338 [Tetrahymena utriculariae]
MKLFQWTVEKNDNVPLYPTCREGHSLTYLPPHKKLLLFAGYSNIRKNDLFFYDIHRKTWKLQQGEGRSPSNRCFHESFYDQKNDCFFVYGGQADKGRSLGDFYFLNVKTMIWKRLFLLDSPPTRHSHTMTDMQNGKRQKLLFGGICLPENTYYNDVWIFDYENLQFNSSLPDVSGAFWTKKICKGDIPIARRGHCAITVEGCLYLFGGRTINDSDDTSTIYSLNYDTWVWRKVKTIGKAPSPRSFFSATQFTNNRLVIFGGIDNSTNAPLNETYILQLDDFVWSAPFTAGKKPTSRFNHSACFVKNDYNECSIIIQGGIGYTYCSMELNVLSEIDTDQYAEWEKIKEPSQEERLTSELAGLTILDYKRQLHNLDELISQERIKRVDLLKEESRIEDQMILAEEKNDKILGGMKKQIQELDSTYNQNSDLTEKINELINQERQLQAELNQKILATESRVSQMQNLNTNLDQLFASLKKNRFDETDYRENTLKKLLNETKDEIKKQKEQNKETFSKTKRHNDKINRFLEQINMQLQIHEKEIGQINEEDEVLDDD